MLTFQNMPAAVAALPRDERGYPVPWFVEWIDGKPEFRAMDGRKWVQAIREKRCWICGEKLDPRQHVFVIGPMCAINRTTAEPPCHADCAIFSAINCPFLSKPKAHRREANMPEGGIIAGEGIMRNPGVACLWYCRGFEIFNDGRGGQLIRLPGAAMVRWYAEGRRATRAEIMESINGGLPILQDMAAKQGPAAELALRQAVTRGLKLVPAA
jgi:hypothetical protein